MENIILKNLIHIHNIYYYLKPSLNFDSVVDSKHER